MSPCMLSTFGEDSTSAFEPVTLAGEDTAVEEDFSGDLCGELRVDFRRELCGDFADAPSMFVEDEDGMSVFFGPEMVAF